MMTMMRNLKEPVVLELIVQLELRLIALIGMGTTEVMTFPVVGTHASNVKAGNVQTVLRTV